MKRNNNKGFTLAELLIVVAVIAVLVAVAIPTFTNQLEKSRQSVDVSNLRGAYAAARLAEIDQAVGDETFKSVVGSDENTANLIYWYSPETGALTRATNGDSAESAVSAGSAEYGKASKASAVADMSQFSMQEIKTTYGTSLSTDEAGTRDKAILVQFGKTTQSSVYGIAAIKFVKTAVGEVLTAVTKLPADSASSVSAKNVSMVTDAVPADVAETNTIAVNVGKSKSVDILDLFTLTAGTTSVTEYNDTLAEGKVKVMTADPAISYTKNGESVTGIVSVTAGKCSITAATTPGTYSAVFALQAKGKATAEASDTTDYYTKVRVDFVVTAGGTTVMPDTVTFLSAQTGGTLVAGGAIPALVVKYDTTATAAGDTNQTATSGYLLGYSKSSTLTSATSAIADDVSETASKILLVEGNKIPDTMTGMYLYVVSADYTKAAVVQNNESTPAAIEITAP